MPSLTVVIPSPPSATLDKAVATRETSIDSIVTAALSQYFQTDRHRAYQISTSAALVQGVYDGVVHARALLANGDFGLGTSERLQSSGLGDTSWVKSMEVAKEVGRPDRERTDCNCVTGSEAEL